MSERHQDRARVQRDRKRTLHRRQRVAQLVAVLRKRRETKHATAASAHMQDEGGPLRDGD